MISHIKSCLVLCFMLFYSVLGAQVDSSQTLPAVTVRDSRPERIGYLHWSADSFPFQFIRSGAERLSLENPLSVRANGPSNLSTLSARGMGPSHTPVMWNGINLQSPMNGVADAALLPLWPDDQLEIRYGGQSAVQSSGAMGGTVFVNTEGFKKTGFSGNAGLSTGSFGKKELIGALGYGASKWNTSLRADRQWAENDFPYANTTRPDAPTERRLNNGLKKQDIQQFNQFVLSDADRIKTAWWNQQAERGIPQPISSSPRESKQYDRSNKALISWEHGKSPRSLLQTRFAWLDEWIAFRLASDTDTSKSRTAVVNSDYKIKLSPAFSVQAGAQATAQWAQADGYADSSRWYRQRRLAAYVSGTMERPFGQISCLLRQEWAENQAAPFTWSLAGFFRLGWAGKLRFHASRNFNMPTFNDRFWNKWGRADLLPEYGYSADAGWIWGKNGLFVEIGTFQVLIDNWILWQPGSDGFFRPGNLKKVWSRGAESLFGIEKPFGKWHLASKFRYQFTRTTNTAVYGSAVNILGKQLSYVPQHSGSWLLKAARGPVSFLFSQQFTGKRYTATDNSAALPAFYCGNFSTSVQLPFYHSVQCALDLSVNNCWNAQYQFFEYQPLPGRSFQIGAVVKW